MKEMKERCKQCIHRELNHNEDGVCGLCECVNLAYRAKAITVLGGTKFAWDMSEEEAFSYYQGEI